MQIIKRLAVSGASVLASLSIMVAPVAAAPSTVYDATPSVLPPNVASLGFQATSTSEFGDFVHLAGTNRNLKTVTVTMSNWALAETPANVAYCAANTTKCTAEGYVHPITVNIYNVNVGTPNTHGLLVGTMTKDVFIPWRPVANPDCGSGWKAENGTCYNGLAFNATFDMSSLNAVLPNDVIVGVAYNTQSYGTAPTGVDGPYNSLNVGIAEGQTVSVGTDDSIDKTFWNTTYPGYTAGLNEDSGWAPNGTVNIKITADAPFVAAPTNKDQCKGNGWKGFNGVFKNHGDCVSYVATGGRNKPALGTF